MKFFIVALVLASFHAKAFLPESLESLPCKEEAIAIVKKAKSKNGWVRTADPEANVKSYRSPTQEIGKWVEIHTTPNPHVFVFSHKSSKIYQFDAKTCKQQLNIEQPVFSFLAQKGPSFTDENLSELVKSDKPSMVYIWSPSMIYSMKEMGVFIKIAKELNVNFIPVLDYKESIADGKKYVSPYQPDLEINRLKSVELFMREGTTHFPSTYIVGNNFISHRIFGVLTPELLRERVLDELAIMKRDR